VLNRRQLLTWMLVAKMGALLLAATSQNIIVFAIASVLMGITASALMVVTAMVASYAPDHSRGRMVGTVMTGLLLGILLARTVSGTVAQISGGWRTVYVLAAIVVAALLVMLRRILPNEAPRGRLQYGKLMASLADIIRQEPLLRQRALFSGLGLGTFSVFWTGLTFCSAARRITIRKCRSACSAWPARRVPLPPTRRAAWPTAAMRARPPGCWPSPRLRAGP
jgi:predicted MFS family arabinose efflux permease